MVSVKTGPQSCTDVYNLFVLLDKHRWAGFCHAEFSRSVFKRVQQTDPSLVIQFLENIEIVVFYDDCRTEI